MAEEAPRPRDMHLKAIAVCLALVMAAGGAVYTLTRSSAARRTAKARETIDAYLREARERPAAELRDLLRGGSLSVETCAHVARELEILDRSLPGDCHAMRNEAATVGASLLSMAEDGSSAEAALWEDLAGPQHTWRYGFSSRLMIAEAVELRADAVRRAVAAEGRAWPEQRRMLEKIDAETRDSKNPLVRLPLSGLTHLPEVQHRLRARVRLLRIAAHCKATGEVLELADPFGARLRHAQTSAGLKVWSVGRDGEDDGGKGEWKDKADQDLVLEIAR